MTEDLSVKSLMALTENERIGYAKSVAENPYKDIVFVQEITAYYGDTEMSLDVYRLYNGTMAGCIFTSKPKFQEFGYKPDKQEYLEYSMLLQFMGYLDCTVDERYPTGYDQHNSIVGNILYDMSIGDIEYIEFEPLFPVTWEEDDDHITLHDMDESISVRVKLEGLRLVDQTGG